MDARWTTNREELRAPRARRIRESVDRPGDPDLRVTREASEVSLGAPCEADLVAFVGHLELLQPEIALDPLPRDRFGILGVGQGVEGSLAVKLVFDPLNELDVVDRDDGSDRAATSCDQHALVAVRSAIDQLSERLASLADAHMAHAVFVGRVVHFVRNVLLRTVSRQASPGLPRLGHGPYWFGPPFPATVISVDVDELAHPRSLPA